MTNNNDNMTDFSNLDTFTMTTPSEVIISEDLSFNVPIVKILPTSPDFKMPTKATSGSSGFDIYSIEDVLINPGEMKSISTGMRIQLPQAHEAQIRSRSGLAFKHCISVVNQPGTIDQDFVGEVKIGLINHGKVFYAIKKGDRIAQMVIQKVPDVELKVVSDLDDTTRGIGGFGSTGR